MPSSPRDVVAKAADAAEKAAAAAAADAADAASPAPDGLTIETQGKTQ